MSGNQSTHSAEHTFNMSLVKFVVLSPFASWIAVSLYLGLAKVVSGFEHPSLGEVLAPPVFLFFFGLIPWSVCGLIVAKLTKEYMRTSMFVLLLSGVIGSIIYFAEIWFLGEEVSDENQILTNLMCAIGLGFAPSLGFAAYQRIKRRSFL